MRYFLAKDAGGVIREKQSFSGDISKADGLISAFLSAHSGWTAQEVDQPTFDAAVVVVDPTAARAQALDMLANDPSAQMKLIRNAFLVCLDLFNALRVKASPADPALTKAQFIALIQQKTNNGAGD